MTAQEKKSKTPAKAAVKSPAKAASKVADKAKSMVKAAVKAVIKSVAKTSVKAPSKPSPKTAKLPAVAKSVANPAAKKLMKPLLVPGKKPGAKVVVGTVMVKPASVKNKVVAKATSAKPIAKPDTKASPDKKGAVAKPTTRKSIKTTTLQQAKPVAKAVKTPNAAAPPALAKTTQPAKSTAVVPTAKKTVQPVAAPAPSSPPPPRPPENTMLIPAPPALKPGRRSSARALSQMPPPAPMVPTHAPDAAKASYSTMTERVIAPPPHVAAKKDPKLANNWKTTAADALTDDEVKAMPDAEYMNEKQMAFFRHKLAILKQDIHNSAGETTEHLREDTVVVPDPADRATIEEEHALELRTRDRERKLLKKIEQSIARIDSGDYGYCDETGEPIGVGRLIARPTANLSLEAQQRRELKQKMFGD